MHPLPIRLNPFAIMSIERKNAALDKFLLSIPSTPIDAPVSTETETP